MLLRPLQSAINHALSYDQDTQNRLATLDDKLVQLIVTDWGITLWLKVSDKTIFLFNECSGEADAVIEANLMDFAKTGISKNVHAQSKIKFKGDIHLAQTMQQILLKLNIDWESFIANKTGDRLASLISQGASKLKNAFTKQRQFLEQDTKDFLTDDLRALPDKTELTQFYQDINKLRDDTERLLAKVK